MLNVIKKLRGRCLRARLLSPIDEFYDRILRIKTFAYKKYADNFDDPSWKGDYMPTSYKALLFLLKEAKVDKNSVVVDFGSGLGRVVFTAVHFGAKRSIGVEFDEELYLGAESNRVRSRFPHNTSFIHQDASSFIIPDDANIFFFFNPFGNGIMADVIKQIERSLETTPRKVCIIYIHPNYPGALQSSSKFKLIKSFSKVTKLSSAQLWTN